MKTIHRYPLLLEASCAYSLPIGAIIRHVGIDRTDNIAFWAEGDVDAAPGPQRTFEVYGTGHDVPDAAVYVGTALQGQFVWHVYERVS